MYGLMLMSATIVKTIRTCKPLLAALLMYWMHGTTQSWMKIVALIIVACGAACLTLKSAAGFNAIGTSCVLFATMVSALHFVVAAHTISENEVSPLTLMLLITSVSSALILPGAIWHEGPAAFLALSMSDISHRTAICLLLSAVLKFLHSAFAWTLIRDTDPVYCTLLMVLKLPVVIGVTVPLFHDDIGMYGWIGVSLALFGFSSYQLLDYKDERRSYLNINGTPQHPRSVDVFSATLTADSRNLSGAISALKERRKVVNEKMQRLIARRSKTNSKTSLVTPKREIDKLHREFMIAEAKWLAADFQKEIRVKRQLSKRKARWVMSHHARQKRKLVQNARIRLRDQKRVAKQHCRCVLDFWKKIDKIVFFKYRRQIEVARAKLMEKHLDMLVDNTERLTKILARRDPAEGSGCNETKVSHAAKDSMENLVSEDDDDNDDSSEDELYVCDGEKLLDDETTIDAAEAYDTYDTISNEIRLLKEEALMPVRDLQQQYWSGGGSTSRSTSPLLPHASPRGGTAFYTYARHVQSDIENVDFDHANFRIVSCEGLQIIEDDGKWHHAVLYRQCDGLEKEAGRIVISYENCVYEGLGGKPYSLKLSDAESYSESSSPLLFSGNVTQGTLFDGDGNVIPTRSLTVKEQAEAGETPGEIESELATLKDEAEMSVEELRRRYGWDAARADSNSVGSGDRDAAEEDESSKTSGDEDEEDGAFAPCEDTVDDETTMAEAEAGETPGEIESELATLKDEAEMSVEELRRRYGKGTDNASTTKSLVSASKASAENMYSVRQPFLMSRRLKLRDYQRAGLDWLVSLHDRRLNGILADEMGLGKTVQTISLLAHLAAERGHWGPHLVIVPTSVLVNWELECKRWCPAFKVLAYYGTAKERKQKRIGWSKPHSFHICITSYQLVVQDATVFRRRAWYYMILDEAHNIKNFQSQRWQTLLHFNTRRRLLLTGTPLQNSLMELWSLMHFLMPLIFRSRGEFQHWFANPLMNMVEGKQQVNRGMVSRLHGVIRPFLLRRLKKDVEKQMPGKYEHIVRCHLSRRQRFLYEDFISRSSTRAALSGGSVISMMGVLMQLRKVCNHPDLFEERLIRMPLHLSAMRIWVPRLVVLDLKSARRDSLHFAPFYFGNISTYAARRALELEPSKIDVIKYWSRLPEDRRVLETRRGHSGTERAELTECVKAHARLMLSRNMTDSRLRRIENVRRSTRRVAILLPIYGSDLLHSLLMRSMKSSVLCKFAASNHKSYHPRQLLVKSREDRLRLVAPSIIKFMLRVPAVLAPCPIFQAGIVDVYISENVSIRPATEMVLRHKVALPAIRSLHVWCSRRKMLFPDRWLVQWDCGKLQILAQLLRRLKSGGHKVLIFTQMTRMLNILESFLNLHGHTYVRLDGSTKVDERQILMERFNHDPKLFAFILSTRSGGLGINLTGADTVIFYDTDWNPAMDAQAQDRAHRIGQTRDVHIYRLVTSQTVEENIMLKASQKRDLSRLSIEEGLFTTMSLMAEQAKESADDTKESSHRAQLMSSFVGETKVDEISRDRLSTEGSFAEVCVECDQGHRMTKELRDNTLCDECDEGSQGSRKFYHCSVCNFDLCESCSEKRATSHVSASMTADGLREAMASVEDAADVNAQKAVTREMRDQDEIDFSSSEPSKNEDAVRKKKKAEAESKAEEQRWIHASDLSLRAMEQALPPVHRLAIRFRTEVDRPERSLTALSPEELARQMAERQKAELEVALNEQAAIEEMLLKSEERMELDAAAVADPKKDSCLLDKKEWNKPSVLVARDALASAHKLMFAVAASPPGTTIRIATGVYHEPAIIVEKSMRIVAESTGVVIIVRGPIEWRAGGGMLRGVRIKHPDSTALATFAPPKSPHLIHVMRGSLRIMGCDLSNRGGTGACVAVTLRGRAHLKECKIHDSPQSGMIVDGAQASAVRSDFINNRANGITFMEESTGVVRECTFDSNNFVGVQCFSRVVAAIVDNEFQKNRAGPWDMVSPRLKGNILLRNAAVTQNIRRSARIEMWGAYRVATNESDKKTTASSGTEAKSSEGRSRLVVKLRRDRRAATIEDTRLSHAEGSSTLKDIYGNDSSASDSDESFTNKDADAAMGSGDDEDTFMASEADERTANIEKELVSLKREASLPLDEAIHRA
eukprot:g876.t1